MNEQDVSKALASLPEVDMTGPETARARSAAVAAFERAHGRGDEAPSIPKAMVRFSVPLGLAAVVVIYLQWAVSAATALAH